MRRAIPAAVVTLIGLAALMSFRSGTPVATLPDTSRSVAAASPTTATTTPSTSAPPTGSATTTTPATTVPANSTKTRTVDGLAYDNQYGTVQVRVTLQGGTITEITALQMPFEHSRSQYISQQAEPLLRQEALQAQSAQIDIVSGATYTSESYAQSLQSALDNAGR